MDASRRPQQAMLDRTHVLIVSLVLACEGGRSASSLDGAGLSAGESRGMTGGLLEEASSSASTDASESGASTGDDPGLGTTGDDKSPSSTTGPGRGSTSMAETGTPEGPFEYCVHPELDIPDNGGPVSAVLDGVDAVSGDVAIAVTIDHLFIGDLSVEVRHGGETVRLFDQECSLQSDLHVTFSDDGAPLECADSANGHRVAAVDALAPLAAVGVEGAWEFVVEDHEFAISGSLRSVCLLVGV